MHTRERQARRERPAGSSRTEAGAAAEPATESGVTRGPRSGAKRTVLHYIRQLPHYLRLLGGLLTDRRVAIFDKMLVLGAMLYIITPIDLIPDFVPVIGYLDDLILVPIGMVIAVRMIPGPVLAECRERAQVMAERPTSRLATMIIIAIWIAAAALGVFLLGRFVADLLD